MGTNYYARIIPSKSKKEHLKELIDQNNFDHIIDEINQTYQSFKPYDMNDEITGQIHLGKRSGGWKFLWNPNIFLIRNGHSEKEIIEEGHNRYHWVEEPNSAYYVYPLTKKGIKEFIDKEDIEIYDEYNEKQDKDEFFKEALEWTTWKGEEAFDSKSYAEWEQSQGHYPFISTKDTEYIRLLTEEGFNVEWPYNDFYSDGLRFSTSVEFS